MDTQKIKQEAIEAFKKEASDARSTFNAMVAAYPIAISGSDGEMAKVRERAREHYAFLANMSFSASRVFSEVAVNLGSGRIKKALAEAEAKEQQAETQSTE